MYHLVMKKLQDPNAWMNVRLYDTIKMVPKIAIEVSIKSVTINFATNS